MGRGYGKSRRGRTFRERRRGRGFQDPPEDFFLAEAWSTADDTVLWHAANEGVAAAFDALYTRHRQWLAQMAMVLAPDMDDALSLLQDVFQLWYAEFPRPPGSSVRAALYALLRRRFASLRAYRTKVVSLDAYRRRRRGKPLEASHPESSPPAAAPVMTHAFRRPDGLPGELREVALLRFGARFSEQEIAQALDIPLDTLEARLAGIAEHVVAKGPDWDVDIETQPRAADHPRPRDIEALLWRESLANAGGHDTSSLTAQARHVATCPRCLGVKRRLEQFATLWILPIPATIPKAVDRSILLEGHLRAAAIVRRVVEAHPGASVSILGSMDGVEVGGTLGRSRRDLHRADGPPPRSTRPGAVVLLPSARTPPTKHRNLLAAVAIFLVLLGTAIFLGQRPAADEGRNPAPVWRERGADFRWQAND